MIVAPLDAQRLAYGGGAPLHEGGRRMLAQLGVTRATIDRLGQTLSGNVPININPPDAGCTYGTKVWG